MGVPRRDFLRALAGLTPALAALSSLSLETACGGGSVSNAPVGFLSPSSRHTLAALAETLVSPGEKSVSGLPSIEEAGVVDFLDRLLPELPEAVQSKFPILLWGLEHGARVLSFSGRPFTRLDAADRTAFLRGFAESRFEIRRLAFRAIKNLVMLGYYQADAAWPGIGYEGPWIGRAGSPAPRPMLGAS